MAVRPLLVAACLLAGCAGSPAEGPHTGLQDALTAGSAYAFEHRGGVLRMGGGAWQVDLFGHDDKYVGRFDLEQGRVAAEVDAGTAVLRLLAGSGPLTIAGEHGAPGPLRLLPLHVERQVVLATGEGVPDPLGLLGGPLRHDVNVALERPPATLQAWAAGSHRGLRVELRSAGVPIAQGQAADQAGPRPLDAALHPVTPVAPVQPSGDGVDVLVEAQHLDGAVVVESWSHSRIPAPMAPAQAAAPGQDLHSYGTVGADPVRLHVHPGSRGLHAAGERGAVLTLWQADGAWIATARMEAQPAWVPIDVPVVVAVAYGGNVTLGAPRAPGDLGMHAVDVQQWSSPWVYGQGYTQAAWAGPPGVPFHVAREGSFPFCASAPFVRVLQDGAVRGAWVDNQAWSPNGWLTDGTLRIEAAGFAAPGCMDAGVTVRSWLPGP